MKTIPPAVGIHASKLKLYAALLVSGEIKSKVLENDLAGFRWLRSWLGRQGIDVAGLHICMGASAPYGEAAAMALSAMGMRVSDVDPSQAQAWVEDETDADSAPAGAAVLLARYCAAVRPAPWTPPPVAGRTLHVWVLQLQALRSLRRGEHLRLLAHGMQGQEALAAHIAHGIACADDQIRQLERDIDTHLQRHPALARNVELVRRTPVMERPDSGAALCH